MARLRITHKDGFVRYYSRTQDAALGADPEDLAAHGPVAHATLAGFEDRSPDDAFPHHNRVTRSMTRDAA